MRDFNIFIDINNSYTTCVFSFLWYGRGVTLQLNFLLIKLKEIKNFVNLSIYNYFFISFSYNYLKFNVSSIF